MNTITLHNLSPTETDIKYHDFKIICKETKKILYVHRIIIERLIYFKTLMNINPHQYETDNYDLVSLIIKLAYGDYSLLQFLSSIKNDISFDQLLTIIYTLDELLSPNLISKNNIDYDFIKDPHHCLPIDVIMSNLDRADELFKFYFPKKYLHFLQYKITDYVQKNIIQYQKLSSYPIFDYKDYKGRYLFIHAKMMLFIKKEDFSLQSLIDLYHQGKHLPYDKLTLKNSIVKRDIFIIYLIQEELKVRTDNSMLQKYNNECHLFRCADKILPNSDKYTIIVDFKSMIKENTINIYLKNINNNNVMCLPSDTIKISKLSQSSKMSMGRGYSLKSYDDIISYFLGKPKFN